MAWSANGAVPACFASVHRSSSRNAAAHDINARSLAFAVERAVSIPSLAD